MEDKLLKKYYQPNPQSARFYRVYRLSDKTNKWLRPDYASSGSQKSRTTTFRDAFIHELNSDQWGWAADYVTFLEKRLHKQKRVPAFHLACWLYREREWPSNTKPEHIVALFLKEFAISEEEINTFMDISIPEIAISQLFSQSKVSWKNMGRYLGEPEEGGTLTLLGLTAIGPAKKIIFEPAERLNIITGDNGLGKTFLLECAWWVLSGQWAGLQAFPSRSALQKQPSITYQLSGATTSTVVSYDWQTQTWPYKKNELVTPGLTVYARVDGSFAVWDPAKRLSDKTLKNRSEILLALLEKFEKFDASSTPLLFTPDQVWDGIAIEDKTTGKTRIFCNGLLRDWITWQNKPDKYPFETFKKVISRLSPRDLGPLQPGEPARLPEDAREIPTLKYPYGEVPIVHAAAGIRRIVSLAYLIVWAWEEHKAQSDLTHKNPQESMVILIDEIEAHLHPQWQRIILPSLMSIYEDLDKELQIQFLIITHSPLIIASAEAIFDHHKDKLFHLDLTGPQGLKDKVVLEELSFIRHGRIDSWLTSNIFDFKQARSEVGENVIEKAKKLQIEESPSKMDIKAVSQELKKILPEDDPFWPRWISFALKYDIHL